MPLPTVEELRALAEELDDNSKASSGLAKALRTGGLKDGREYLFGYVTEMSKDPGISREVIQAYLNILAFSQEEMDQLRASDHN